MNLSSRAADVAVIVALLVGGVAGYAVHWWIGRRERTRWLRDQGWK